MNFTVTEKAMRPASGKRECFYCDAPVGEHHQPRCVLIKKKVRLRVTIDFEVDEPAAWTKEDIESHRNGGSSWCASNVLNELERYSEVNPCLCGNAVFECLEMIGPEFLDE